MSVLFHSGLLHLLNKKPEAGESVNIVLALSNTLFQALILSANCHYFVLFDLNLN